MGTISKNFSYSEFAHSDTAEKHNIVNAITSFTVRDSLKALVLEVLQPLRDAWKKPLEVSSGYRSPQLNKLVGGVATSQHLLGEAADIKAKVPYDLAKMARDLKLPYDQMILYPTFVHFSHKLNGAQRGRILYSKDYRGKRF